VFSKKVADKDKKDDAKGNKVAPVGGADQKAKPEDDVAAKTKGNQIRPLDSKPGQADLKGVSSSGVALRQDPKDSDENMVKVINTPNANNPDDHALRKKVLDEQMKKAQGGNKDLKVQPLDSENLSETVTFQNNNLDAKTVKGSIHTGVPSTLQNVNKKPSKSKLAGENGGNDSVDRKLDGSESPSDDSPDKSKVMDNAKNKAQEDPSDNNKSSVKKITKKPNKNAGANILAKGKNKEEAQEKSEPSSDFDASGDSDSESPQGKNKTPGPNDKGKSRKSIVYQSKFPKQKPKPVNIDS